MSSFTRGEFCDILDGMKAAVLADSYQHASAETQRMVDRLLRQDADDQAWAEQIGPAYRQADVAALLGKTKQAVSIDHRLLRLPMRSGAIGYPACQFDGKRLLPGVSDVVAALSAVVETPWTIASWLTSPHRALEGARPLDALRAGAVDEVVAMAEQTAAALAG